MFYKKIIVLTVATLGIFCGLNVYADETPSGDNNIVNPNNTSSNVSNDTNNQTNSSNDNQNNSSGSQGNSSSSGQNNNSNNQGKSPSDNNEPNNGNQNPNGHNNSTPNNNDKEHSNGDNNNKEIVFDNQKTLNYKTRFKRKWHKKYVKGYKDNSQNKYKINSNENIYINRQGQLKSKTYYQISSGEWINADYFDHNVRYINKVPLIAQRPQLPTGCEITALTMMLKYAGVHKNKMQLAKEMPRSSNPNKGFVGSPYSKSGWYIYPKGLTKIVKKYLGSVKNMTGCSIYKIKKQININHPVVVWLAHIDGFPNHALTVYGYDENYLYMNDPWKYKRIKLTYNNFKQLHKADAKRALSY
ncbi:C39 family peptidase [Apilactobacillus xinyiensis]|uniref:C39 family peptidase n=1 Tax=Apilactobacillus xinyiensis TaxID=2841032 RepID=UPI00200FCCA9|nr:C39 family peptidase [Apilactobacillus xinyiensis]MCL0318749.1 C39 family peptidase [Apilactobacillus xinyiensis]